MTRTNWNGTPVDVAEIRARKLYGDACSIEIGIRPNLLVSLQTIGPRGGLSDVTTLTPDNARAMADALIRYARQADSALVTALEGQGR